MDMLCSYKHISLFGILQDFYSEKYERKHNINQMSITMNKKQANKKPKEIKLKCGMSGHNSPQLWSLGAKTLTLSDRPIHSLRVKNLQKVHFLFSNLEQTPIILS